MADFDAPEHYEGLVVAEIARQPDRVIFENGLVLKVGDEHGVDSLAVWKDQIRQTIRRHLERQDLIDSSIYDVKVLSLFFRGARCGLRRRRRVNATVQREYYLGVIDWEEVSGGRVDIRIECKNNIFLIENKIYAGLQQLQLERYLNACTDTKHKVVLLTLDKNDSVLGAAHEKLEKAGLIWLTYQEDILPWLEICKRNGRQ